MTIDDLMAAEEDGSATPPAPTGPSIDDLTRPPRSEESFSADILDSARSAALEGDPGFGAGSGYTSDASVVDKFPPPWKPSEIRQSEPPGFLETLNLAANPWAETTTPQKTEAEERLGYNYVFPALAQAATGGGPLGFAAAVGVYGVEQAIKNKLAGDPAMKDMTLGDAMRSGAIGSMGGDFPANATKLLGGDLAARMLDRGPGPQVDPFGPQAGLADPKNLLPDYTASDALHAIEPALLPAVLHAVPKLASALSSAAELGPVGAVRRWAGAPPATEAARVTGHEVPTDFELRPPQTDSTVFTSPMVPPLTSDTKWTSLPDEAPPLSPAAKPTGIDLWKSVLTQGNRRLGLSDNPVAVEAGQQAQLRNELSREWAANAQGIKGQILGGLEPGSQDLEDLLRLASWEEASPRIGAIARQAYEQGLEPTDLMPDVARPEIGPPDVYAERARRSAVADANTQLAAMERLYTERGGLEPRIPEALDQLRARILEPFNEINRMSGRLTRDPITGEIGPYQGVPNFFPRYSIQATEGLDRGQAARANLTPLEAGRTMAGRGANPDVVEVARQAPFFDPGIHSSDVNAILDRYINETAHGGATTTAFGPSLRGGQPGNNLATALGTLERQGSLFDRDVLKQIADSVYAPERGPQAEAVGSLRGALSRALLARAPLTNIPQVANNIAIAGWRNTAKGLIRALIDPNEARLFDYAGASDPGLVNFYRDVGADPETLSMRGLGAVEHGFLRSRGAMGYPPHLEEVGRNAAAELAANDAVSPRTAEEARFYGVSPEDLASQTELYGRPDMIRPLQTAISQSQFHGDPGEMPEWMVHNPFGSLVGMYRGFSQRQGNYLVDNILKPMISDDAQVRELGRTRLGRLLATSIALGVPMAQLKGVIAGRGMLDVPGLVADQARSVAGNYGDIAAMIGAGGTLASTRAASIPITAVGGDIGREVGLIKRSLGHGEAPLDPMAALVLRYGLPMWNPSGLGIEALLGPAAYGAVHRAQQNRPR